jgi:hypothetical protein
MTSKKSVVTHQFPKNKLTAEERIAINERRAEVVRLHGRRVPLDKIAGILGVSVAVVRKDIQIATKLSQQKLADVAATVRLRNLTALDAVIETALVRFVDNGDNKAGDILVRALDTQNRMMGLYLRDGGESNTLHVNIINAEQYSDNRYNVQVQSDGAGNRAVVVDGEVIDAGKPLAASRPEKPLSKAEYAEFKPVSRHTRAEYPALTDGDDDASDID